MCGICGIVGVPESEAIPQVSRMLQNLVHRGPDGQGVFHSSTVSLGSRRLSIIDIAEGQQPLFNENKDLVLVANAEIYNFIELREELCKQGHQFRTKSDCEVILHLYEEYGVDCLSKLRGMFAFALYDRLKETLFIARDRLGEKPLYIYRNKSSFYFASELKGLIKSKVIPVEINFSSLKAYFEYQYVPEPNTLLKDVYSLPAAQALLINANNGSVLKNWSYWSLEDIKSVGSNPVQQLKEELHHIGKIIVRADTDIGVALSGGLDSAVVGALAAMNKSGIKAFSIGYEGYPAVDERKFAKKVAESLGLEHYQTEITARDVVNDFDNLVKALDQPIADMAGFGYFLLAKLAKTHGVKVLLFGHGGDELFWGYKWVQKAITQNSTSTNIGRHDLYAYSETVNIAKQILPKYYTPDFSNWEMPKQEINGMPETLGIRITRLLVDTYLRTNGIEQTERLSMSVGVEVRLPLLDYRFVELVMGIRKIQEDNKLLPKALLKYASQGIVPSFVTKRVKKPFLTPIRYWHKHLFDNYHERIRNGWLLSSGVLTPEGAVQLSLGRSGVCSGTSLSLKALVFETWHRNLFN